MSVRPINPYVLLLALCHCTERPLLDDSGESTAGTGDTTATDSAPTTTVNPTLPPPTTEPPPTTDPPTTTPTTPTTDSTSTSTTFPTTDTDSETTIDPPDTDTTIDPPDTETDGTTEPLIFDPLALELADFDGDGALDLLTLGVDQTFTIASRLERGHGDGTFDPFIDAGLLASSSAFPTIGDLDSTPGADVILAKDGGLALSRWLGGGPFMPWTEIVLTNLLVNTRVLDGDKDGDVDVYALWLDPDVTKFGVTFVPNSAGNFFFAPVDTEIGAIADLGITPGGLLVGDLDVDGFADALVFESNKQDSLFGVRGTLPGTFTLPTALAPGFAPWTGDLADMDGDLDLDAVFLVRTQPGVAVMRNDGNGELTTFDLVDAPGGFTPFTLDIADLDGDGVLDVAVVDDTSAVVTVWRGNGDGSLDPVPTQTPLPSPAVRVHAGRIDGDAKADLAVATFAVDTVTVLLSP